MSTQIESVAEAAVEQVEVPVAVVSPVVDQSLIDQLVGGARAQGVAIDGEDGLLSQLTKLLVESALEGELSAHLGMTNTSGPRRAMPGTGRGRRPC